MDLAFKFTIDRTILNVLLTLCVNIFIDRLRLRINDSPRVCTLILFVVSNETNSLHGTYPCKVKTKYHEIPVSIVQHTGPLFSVGISVLPSMNNITAFYEILIIFIKKNVRCCASKSCRAN